MYLILVRVRTSNSNNSAVFYIPQTTLSQVHSVAYVVGRINGVNDTDALYRFTLDTNGQWSNPHYGCKYTEYAILYHIFWLWRYQH